MNPDSGDKKYAGIESHFGVSVISVFQLVGQHYCVDVARLKQNADFMINSIHHKANFSRRNLLLNYERLFLSQKLAIVGAN